MASSWRQYIWHVVTALFAIYIIQSIRSLYSVYHTPVCTGKQCAKPISSYREPVQLRIYTSPTPLKGSTDLRKDIFRLEDVDIHKEITKDVKITLPSQTLRNGSLWVHVVLLSQSEAYVGDPKLASWYLIQTALLTTHITPEASPINLMDNDKGKEEKNAPDPSVPVTHLRSVLPVAIVSDPPPISVIQPPVEVSHLLKGNGQNEYYPIFCIDNLSFRTKDLVPVKPDVAVMNLTVEYRPLSLGKLRLLIVADRSVEQLKGMGFSEKDVDDVKGIFIDTNFYFLALTLAVSAVHVLLDFLSFKNDVNFWRHRHTLTGLSARTVVWNCISHTVIMMYLLDQRASKLVLIPSFIGTFIEFWKVYKTFQMRVRLETAAASRVERETEAFDAQGMRYLALVMTPLCIGGAVYSLLYVPHKSWLSWLIQSLANLVYAFGFLFMLPQLFINYKLKSVAHLPWRAFMYKAFNTFIDDMFAFIIQMPVAHRLACFRDDVVFVIYLYQRWLYPVDRARVNEYGESFEDDVPIPGLIQEDTQPQPQEDKKSK